MYVYIYTHTHTYTHVKVKPALKHMTYDFKDKVVHCGCLL